MSKGLPRGWESVTVGEVANVKRGASPRPIQDPLWWGGNVGWVRISDVTSSRKYLTKTTQYLSDAGVNKSVKIEKGEVVLSICATIGRPIIIGVDACIHDGFVWFDKLRSNIDREFWYYFLLSKEPFLSSQRQSGTQGNLNTSIVSDLTCYIPPLPEQQKIAAILTAVDDVIESTQAQIDKLKDLKTGMMQELLTKGIGRGGHPHTEFKDSPVGRIPKGWTVVQLGTVLEKIDSGWSPNCVEIPPNIGEWGVLKVSSVTRDVFLEEQSKTLPSNLEPRESIRVKQGDILLTRANGVADLVGKCVIVKEEPKRKLMMSDKLLRLNPNNKIDGNFLLHIFNSNVIRRQIEFCWGGSSGQKNIGQADMKLFSLPLPPLDEQKTIGRSISQIDNFLDVKIGALNHLVSTKKALMQDLLTGKVRVEVTQK